MSPLVARVLLPTPRHLCLTLGIDLRPSTTKILNRDTFCLNISNMTYFGALECWNPLSTVKEKHLKCYQSNTSIQALVT